MRPFRALLLIVPVLAGCSSFRPPTLAVEEVAVADATDEALALSIVMELHNPNTAPVELYEFRYSVTVDGAKVYSGRRSGGATLSAAGSRTVSLPAVVPYLAAGWHAGDLPADTEYAISGHLRYNAPTRLAEILFDTGVRRPKVRFGGKGRIAISD